MNYLYLLSEEPMQQSFQPGRFLYFQYLGPTHLDSPRRPEQLVVPGADLRIWPNYFAHTLTHAVARDYMPGAGWWQKCAEAKGWVWLPMQTWLGAAAQPFMPDVYPDNYRMYRAVLRGGFDSFGPVNSLPLAEAKQFLQTFEKGLMGEQGQSAYHRPEILEQARRLIAGMQFAAERQCDA